jgi:predicted RNA-binding Zn ribbon-like protein
MSPLISSRETGCIQPKAQRILSKSTAQAAKALALVENNLSDRPSILQVLKAASRKGGMKPDDFPEFEAALVECGATLWRKDMPGTP